MREQWARNIAIMTGILLVLMAMIFSMIQNPSKPQHSTVDDALIIQDTTVQPDTTVQADKKVQPKSDLKKQALIATGRSVFETQKCLRCHSIAGKGNPRYPLDGVGQRRTADSIRQWILAPAELKDQLPTGAFQVKQAYRNQSPEDINALVAYLQSL
jgi:mono/diheme cytochrome c family protein